MKSLFCLLLLTAFATVLAQSVAVAKIDYELMGVKFRYSAKFRQLETIELPAEAAMFVDKKRESDSVFIIVPQTPQGLKTQIELLRDSFASSLLPTESKQFQWRVYPDPYLPPAGNFDRERGQMTGFNGKSCVLLEYRRIEFQSKEFVVGYIYVMDNSARAAWTFQHTAGGLNGNTGTECAAIIRSITGEDETKVRIGQPPPMATGASPPAVKKP